MGSKKPNMRSNYGIFAFVNNILQQFGYLKFINWFKSGENNYKFFKKNNGQNKFKK